MWSRKSSEVWPLYLPLQDGTHVVPKARVEGIEVVVVRPARTPLRD